MAASAAESNSTTPLAGVSILVTRAREQANALIEPLENLGAEVLAFPAIETLDPEDWGPADAAIGRLGEYDWIILTSTNGVDRFFGRLASNGIAPADVRARIAVVGSATAKHLARLGVEPDLVPASDFRAEGLVECLIAEGVGAGTRVLLPRAAEAREVLPEELRKAGATVDVVPVYRLGPGTPPPDIIARLEGEGVDIITFASGGTARHLVEAMSRAGLDPRAVIQGSRVASVGPVTTQALRGLGYEADIEAEESTMASLVDAIVRDVAGGK